jgi:diacylglycerol kinase (ATP)
MKLNPGKLLKSFGFAFKGMGFVIRSQQNFRIHLFVACMVVIAGFFFHITPPEWCIIVLAISMVLAMEILNTAIEKLVDFVSPGFHHQAGIIKDLAAAAVLLTAIGAVIAGIIIFLPKLLSLAVIAD